MQKDCWPLLRMHVPAALGRPCTPEQSVPCPGRIRNAGEMNGFLKTDGQRLGHPLAVAGDAIKLDPGFAPN
ncbi:MAG: hypothetical protein OES46_18935 [Gammaproteobacteria bacterium]|nr:hypothetical protein [Gammaproteobacteria bacterium]